ncbi:MAG: chloride channel protein [Acidilobus sp.]|nr:chloride channel protein [Acidilobus sp.]
MAGLRLSSMPYYERWFVAGIIIGVLVGLGALSIYYLVVALSKLLLMAHVSLFPVTASQYRSELRWLLLMPAVLAAAFPLSYLAALALRTPEVGSDRVVRAYHRNLRLGANEAPAAALSSAITIGLGGSAGMEGPASHVGAALAQLMSRVLGMSAEDRRRALAVGLGAGIGAIFKTPFAGALLSAELLYRRDVEPDVIYPAFIASSVAYAVYGSFTGFSPLLGLYAGPFRPLYLALFALEGLVAGGVAMLYPRALHGLSSWLRARLRNPLVRTALMGAAVGALVIVFPEDMGEGLSWLRALASGGQVPSLLPFALALALLPFSKILTTSLTLGSGAKGGVFAPGLDIGAFTGLAFGEALHLAMPKLFPDVVPFMVVGMLSTFGAASQAPISSMLMTVEMTGSLTLLPGEMIALAVAMMAFRGPALLKDQVESRALSPVHAGEYPIPVLRRVRVSEVPPRQVYVRQEAKVAEALSAITSSGLLSLPVVDRLGRVLGIVNSLDLRTADPEAPAIRYLRPEPGHVRPDSSLEEAVNMMSRTNSRYVIVEEDGKFIGIVTLDDVVKAYEREAAKGLAAPPG